MWNTSIFNFNKNKMKTYLRKLAIVISGILIFFGMNYSINEYYISNEKIRIDEPILLMGGSHIKSGLDPNIIRNSKNIAQGAENYFLTYFKLKDILSNSLNNITDVVIALDYQNLSSINDIKFYNDNYVYEFLKRSYAITPYKKLNRLPLNMHAYIKTMIRYKLLYPSKKHKRYCGSGFNPRKPNLKSDNFQKRYEHYYNQNPKSKISLSSIEYLDSIIQITDNHNINLIVINIPQEKKFYDSTPKSIVSKYQEITSALKYKGIKYFDFSKLEVENNDFANLDHLSKQGATKISKILDGYLNDDK